MLYKNISIDQTGLYSKLILDYIHQKEEVRSFYEFVPKMDVFEEVIQKKAFSDDQRNILVTTLLSQYQEIDLKLSKHSKVLSNIESLKKSTTFTVTTGHQLALFTGPLFFIYKILSTIRLAEELCIKYPNQDFVPVFWLASEDHDFAEINHVHVSNQQVEWKMDSHNRPVGELPLTEMKQVIQELKEALGSSNPLIELFENCYLQSNNLSEATRRVVHALFGEYGLVMMEPNDKRLKQAFIQVMKDDIIDHSSFSALLQTNAQLSKNYKLQITGREINFFYLSEAGRNLIQQTTKGFEVVNTPLVFSEAEMLQEIESFPERFSPNVVLRPVYQEMVLPNLAYIGGPGEVAYWLQLKGVFKVHQVAFPMVILRNSILLVKQSILHKLEKKKVNIEQLFLPIDAMVKQFINQEQGLSLTDQKIEMERLIQSAIDQVMLIDNQIGSKLISLKLETSKHFEKLDQELYHRQKIKSESDIQLLTEIKQQLFPANNPQERYANILSFAGTAYPMFIEQIAKTIFPLSNTMDICVWD